MTQNRFARHPSQGAGWGSTVLHGIGMSAVLLALPTLASAHILDEYEQATRIALTADHVTLKVRLTAGVEIASQVFALIDTNKDGQISRLPERIPEGFWV